MKSFFKIWLVTLSVIAVGFSQNKKTIVKEVTINFDSASSVISEIESQKVIEVLKDLMNDKNSYSFEISAYTDSKGSVDYNKELSVQRAISSANFLVNSGFLRRKISFTAKGEFDPLADNDSEIGRAKNRRVKVKVYLFDDNKNSISGFTIQEKAYTINCALPQEVTYDSGTIIKIPESAFVDKNGNPISGEVQLNYIEYRDPVDFILGNIPMDYNHDGENFHFNSGGMFKVGATKNGEEVFLNKEKNLELDFKLTENLPDLNFYKFDESKNEWLELQKNITNEEFDSVNLDKFLSSKTETKVDTIVSSSLSLNNIPTQFQNSKFNFNCRDLYTNLEIGKIMASSKDSLYNKTLLVPKNLKNVNIKKQRTAQYQLTNSLRAKQIFQTVKKDYVIKCDAVLENEKLVFNANSDSYINKINNIKWISTEGLSNFKMESAMLYGIIKSGQNSYSITLKDSLNNKELNNLSVENFDKHKEQLLDNIITQLKNRQVQIKRMDNLISKQDQTSDKKRKIIDYYKKIRYCSKDTITKFSKLIEGFWTFNTTYMTPDEKAMSMVDWIKYFDDNKALMLNRYSDLLKDKEFQYCYNQEQERRDIEEKQNRLNTIDANVRQQLKISSLGIYNCDQIQRLYEPVIVDAEYKDDKGNSITPVYIYIVDSKINGILQYNGYGGYSPFHFAFSPYSENVLLAFDVDGNSYIYDAKKMKDIDTKKVSQSFVLNKIENITDKSQLASLLN